MSDLHDARGKRVENLRLTRKSGPKLKMVSIYLVSKLRRRGVVNDSDVSNQRVVEQEMDALVPFEISTK